MNAEELAAALSAVMALIENGDLVRNPTISDLGHSLDKFVYRSFRIATALQKAQNALRRDYLTIPA